MTDLQDPTQRVIDLLVKSGTPKGRMRGLLWRALQSDIARALPIQDVAEAFLSVTVRVMYAAGLNPATAAERFAWAYHDAVQETQQHAEPQP